MKKFLAILFAVLFAFSCMSIMAFADDAAAATTSVIIPEKITINNVSYVVCPYCDKTCGSGDSYEKHLDSCVGYTSYKVDTKENTCYYCGETLKTEKALNEHYAYYVNAKKHVTGCAYSGEDYANGGCPAQFTIKEEYEKHVAQCPYEGQYSVKGYLKLILSNIWAFIKAAVTGADFSGLTAGMDTSVIKDTGSLIVAVVKTYLVPAIKDAVAGA